MKNKNSSLVFAKTGQILSRPQILRPPILRRLNVALVIGGLFVLAATRTIGQTVLFSDDFAGPALNAIWQASLPNATTAAGGPAKTYVGAPSYAFSSLDGNSVLRMPNTLSQNQRCGWSSSTTFTAPDFRYEVRFNTLDQATEYIIDGFIEIWILDAADPGRYDIVSLFDGDYGRARESWAGSTIDNAYSQLPFNYQNSTYYRLVLQCAPGQNVRASVCDDDGTELFGRTFAHGASAFSSGFKIVLSQFMGLPNTPSPVDVAVDSVTLSTLTGGAAPTITTQPQSQTANEGTNVTLSVVANGGSLLSYQWRFNGTNLAGMTATSLLLTNVQLEDTGDYTVAVSNSLGYAISDPATLTILAAPVILVQPRGQVGYWGKSVSFSIKAKGTAPLAYLWYKDTIPISWATNSTLVLDDLDFNDAGDYQVVVSNSVGSAPSTSAWLTANPAGVTLGLYPGLTIDGVVGRTYGIQYVTNVTHTNVWTSLTTLTLTQSVELWIDTGVDVSSGANPRRFYRVVAVP